MFRSPPRIEIAEVTDPLEIQAAKAQREQFDRNSDWLAANIVEVCGKYRGKHLCIAGQEVFAADDVREAIARATAAHPDDLGWFTSYVPEERVLRV